MKRDQQKILYKTKLVVNKLPQFMLKAMEIFNIVLTLIDCFVECMGNLYVVMIKVGPTKLITPLK